MVYLIFLAFAIYYSFFIIVECFMLRSIQTNIYDFMLFVIVTDVSLYINKYIFQSTLAINLEYGPFLDDSAYPKLCDTFPFCGTK